MGEKVTRQYYLTKPSSVRQAAYLAAVKGISTRSSLNRLGVDDSIIQRMLRHSKVNVAQTFYIKGTGDDVRVAMEKMEQDYAAKTAVRISRTVTGH